MTSTLTELLASLVRVHFPAFAFRDEHGFFPMAELERGDFSSGVAIALAAETRRSAHEIAALLIEDLRQRVGLEWRCDSGFIVVRSDSDNGWEAEAGDVARMERAAGKSPDCIVALVPDASVPLYAALRILATAALQAWIAVQRAGACCVVFAPDSPVDVYDLKTLAGAVRDVARKVLNEARAGCAVDGGRSAVSDALVEFSKGKSNVFVWTAHHYADSFDTGARKNLACLREQGATVRMPSDGWLISRERVLPELLSPRSLSEIMEPLLVSDHDGDLMCLSWILHFAGPVASGDLDPAVFRFDEAANVRWCVTALAARLRTLFPHGERRPLRGGAATLGYHHCRTLWMRSTFLPVWIARAAARGDVLPCMQVIHDFALEGHAALNVPIFRSEVASGELSHGACEIVASAQSGVSAILGFVGEESCAHQ